MTYKQGNPYCIQIEFTEGCQLRCDFCGLNGIRGKNNNFKFMTLSTMDNILKSMVEHGWNSRIELAMHGEPTFNPELLRMIQLIRRRLPKAYILMESNGGGIVSDPRNMIRAMFNSGLSCLAIDEYQDIKLADKIFDKILSWGTPGVDTLYFNGGPVSIHDYPSCGKVGNPHQRQKFKRLVRVRPIDVSTSGTHSSLSNHAGAGGPLNSRGEGKRCAKPFREVSVRWDGSVAVCCNDWRGVLPVGNVNEVDLHEDIWHSPIMYAARRHLYHGERNFGPCFGCDARSYRPGILPDHKGQEELPEPDQEDWDTLQDATRLGPLTKPFLRDWEK